MSGHSKWHNIKLKKGKVDAQRGALFTKLSKEIILAAKNGSPDPEANYRLKMAVEKAREFNMPQDNIKRAIARASGQGGEREIEEIRYEGTGRTVWRWSRTSRPIIAIAPPANYGLFLAVTRALGETNGVAWMFDAGRHRRDLTDGKSEDDVMERALVDGVEDIEYDDDVASIYTAPGSLAEARDALRAQGIAPPMRTSGCGRQRKSSFPAKMTFRWPCRFSTPWKNTKTCSAFSPIWILATCRWRRSAERIAEPLPAAGLGLSNRAGTLRRPRHVVRP